MHQMKVEGRCLAKVSATRFSWASGMPVIFSTTAGGYFFTSSRTCSMPQTRWAMYSLSSQPFSKMCHMMPQTTAMSVPGRIRT